MQRSGIIKTLPRDNEGRLILDSLIPGEDYEIEAEDKGRRRKKWIRFQDKRYLVKEIKQETYEDYAELLVEQLCLQLGMPTAHYDLATLNGKPCVMTEDFIKAPMEKMESGKTFLLSAVRILVDNGLYTRIDDNDQKELNNLKMIERCLAIYLPEDKLREVMKSFDMLFALNCFCINGDIHLDNWSVIKDRTSEFPFRLAPNYDFASYFRFNISKSNILKHIVNLRKQRKTRDEKKYLEDYIFGEKFNKYNSLTYCYTSTNRLGFTRLEAAFLAEPERFVDILQRLYELDPRKAVMNVQTMLGANIPEDCAEWFTLVVECNQRRIEQTINSFYTKKGGYGSYGA